MNAEIKGESLVESTGEAGQTLLLRRWFLNPSRSEFFRHVIGTYSTQLLMALLSLASGVIVARALGPEGRGAYAVALVIVLIGVQLGSLGLQGSNTYFVAMDRTLLSSLLWNSMLASLAVGGVAFVLSWAAFRGLHLVPPVEGALIALALVGIPLGTAYLFGVNLLMGLQLVRSYNTIELLNKGLATLLMVLAAWFAPSRPAIFLSVLLLAQAASLSLAIRMLVQAREGGPGPSVALLRQSLRVSWKIYLSCLFGFLVIRIDLLMVRYMLGTSATGFYSVAVNLADFVFMLPTAIAALLFPRLSGLQDSQQKKALMLRTMKVTGAVLLAIVLILGVSSKLIVVLLFGKVFAPATSAVLLLAPGILFLGLESVLVQYVNSCGFPASVVGLWIASTVLNVVLNLWAIPAFGINGAAAVSSFSYLLIFAGVALITRRYWSQIEVPAPLTAALVRDKRKWKEDWSE